MRLTSITIQKFKNFVDPKQIGIEDDVTALVGKNESGKTTVLKALHRLNPANGSGLKFNLTQEYPRWRLARDRRADEALSKLRPVVAEFALEDDDLAGFEEVFGVRPPLATKVGAARTYDNGSQVWLTCAPKELIRKAAEDVEITGDDLDELISAGTLDAARSLAKQQAKDLKETEPLRAKAMTAFGPAPGKYNFGFDGRPI